jgi:hypothetical protein
MSTTSHADILSQALTLPEGDRVRLAGDLLASVQSPGGLSVDDEDFEDELSRRSQEIAEGIVTAIDADASIEAIRRSLAERRTP